MSDQTRTPAPEDASGAAHTAPAAPAQEVAAGDRVICWDHKGPAIYDGPSDHPGMNEWRLALFSGELPRVKCNPRDVAPAGTAVPERDDRVHAEKRPAAERPYGAHGYWKLTLPGVPRSSWHKTKRDATEAGCRQLAILDWHTARAPKAASN